MQLIYRGFTYEYTPTVKATRSPRAVNWRYEIPGQTCENSSFPEIRSPRAVNWRYQIPAFN